MKKSRSRWVFLLLTIVIAGAFIFLGYNQIKLMGERDDLRAETKNLNTKVVLLKKKYSEQKALADAMRRAKEAAESNTRGISGDVKKLEKENQELHATIGDLTRQINRIREEHKAAIAKHEERYAALRDAYDKLREESIKKIKDRDQQIAKLTNDNQSLQASLSGETYQHNRCKGNNKELATLAEELLNKYENKGVLSSLSQDEPFTQFKKVRLEKLIQEYRDKIDKEKL